ncbi:MAG: N-acetyltransferase [Chloroflexota bacterium]|nr:MAG: N-acetyltransferase [Chloroflexota bacterium]
MLTLAESTARPADRDGTHAWLHRPGLVIASIEDHDGPVDAPSDLGDARIRLRPITDEDREPLGAILAEPEVGRWWVHDDVPSTLDGLFEDDGEVRMTILVEDAVAGLIQYVEETTPDYRHAGIDLFAGAAWQGRGIGPDAIRLVARHLFDVRGHHRLTIDPAAANLRAIRAYEKVGFRPVGVMRSYERGADGTWHDGLLMDLLREEFEA